MELKEIELKKIEVNKKDRSDYGNMTELTASIREQGLIEPIIVRETKTGYDLIAGERRIKAYQALKKEKILANIVNLDDTESYEIMVVENIQRKNLNPIEEGLVFDKYLYETSFNIEHLAKRIGKSVEYIKRRIALKGLAASARDALIKKKIQLGHAAILARLENKDQKEALKNINMYELSVSDVENYISHDKIRSLTDALFDKSKGPDGNGKGDTGCKNCPYNGEEQTLLVDAGKALEGKCMRPACYLGKATDWMKKEKQELEKKGITVLYEKSLNTLPYHEAIQTWDKSKYNTAVKNLNKKPDTYAVVFYWPEHKDFPEKRIYRIKESKTKKAGSTEDVIEEAADKLNFNRDQKLKGKVDGFKRQWQIEEAQKLLKPGSTTKAVVMHKLLHDFKYDALFNNGLKKYFDMNDADLEKEMCELAKDIFEEMDEENLAIAAKATGVDPKEHFQMSEEFLNLYQKVQLEDLAKELKISIEGLKKNGEIKEAIIAGWQKGQVPKIMR